jgi:hypothetical protein
MTAVTEVSEEYPERVSGPREPPPPLDLPMVPFALAGTAAWVVVGLVGLAAGAADGLLWTALAGVLVGLALLGLMVVHDRGRNRRTG